MSGGTIDKELLRRLPRTFVPALNEQLDKWELLFPAEQRTLQEQFGYLADLPARDLDRLFQPVKDLESKMRLPAWDTAASRIGIEDTSVLVRSPYYTQWRAEVEKVFAHIDDAILASSVRTPRRNIVISVLPNGLPPVSGSVWNRSEPASRVIRLDRPFGEGAAALVESLARRTSQALDPVERVWLLDAGDSLGQTSPPAAGSAVRLSFEALGPVRTEFLKQLNAVRKDLRSADQAYENLRRLDLAPFLDERLRKDPRLTGFVRDLFLSGNGALLFGNSFAEWGASEALRRAQPQLLVCLFGVRRKLKPFSSVAVFEDQGTANPVPDEDDAAGSLSDTLILAEYVFQATFRMSEYVGRTLGLFAIQDSSTVQLAGLPRDAGWPDSPSSPAELAAGIGRWLEEGA